MNPFERWDDWEWERAIQEVGQERGSTPKPNIRQKKFKLERNQMDNVVKFLNKGQSKTLLAALLFLTVFFSSKGEDILSRSVLGFYQTAMGSGNYYASLSGMAKEAMGLGGIKSESIPVDVTMQGKFLPPLSGPVVAGFGEAGKDSNGKTTTHTGIDVGSALGIPVVSPYRGVVTSVGEDEQIGRFVKLNFGDGWTAVLGNLGDISVQQGSRVEKGDLLGKVGLSAPLKKPWLHFELLKDNKPLNPIPYLIPPK